jgi:dihydrofolate reductase
MRKITAGLFISLDGVVEAPDQWHFPYFNDEMGAAVNATLGAADTILFGRKTYDSFAGAWPERKRPVRRTPPSPRSSATPARSSYRTSSSSSPGGTPNSCRATSSRPSPR